MLKLTSGGMVKGAFPICEGHLGDVVKWRWKAGRRKDGREVVGVVVSGSILVVLENMAVGWICYNLWLSLWFEG